MLNFIENNEQVLIMKMENAPCRLVPLVKFLPLCLIITVNIVGRPAQTGWAWCDVNVYENMV